MLFYIASKLFKTMKQLLLPKTLIIHYSPLTLFNILRVVSYQNWDVIITRGLRWRFFNIVHFVEYKKKKIFLNTWWYQTKQLRIMIQHSIKYIILHSTNIHVHKYLNWDERNLYMNSVANSCTSRILVFRFKFSKTTRLIC